MVDHQSGGIWYQVNSRDNQPDQNYTKQNIKKNAFHSFEHTLCSYITGCSIHDEPSTLYFAFSQVPEDTQIKPYLFGGKIESLKQPRIRLPIPNLVKTIATFVDIH